MLSMQTAEDLIAQIRHLGTPDLERVLDSVIALKAERLAPHLSSKESDLLLRINRGFPDESALRYRELIARRRDGALTAAEYEELLRLTEEDERLQAERVESLGALARLRGLRLTELMEQLGLGSAPDA
jgi:hypothetical protein